MTVVQHSPSSSLDGSGARCGRSLLAHAQQLLARLVALGSGARQRRLRIRRITLDWLR